MIDNTQKVQNWLITGGPVGGQISKPYLFCYHNWEVLKHMTDNFVDIRGDPVKNSAGELETFNDYDLYTKDQQRVSDIFDIPKEKVYPVS